MDMSAMKEVSPKQGHLYRRCGRKIEAYFIEFIRILTITVGKYVQIDAWVRDMKLLVIIREIIDDGGWYESVRNPGQTTTTNIKNSRIS